MCSFRFTIWHTPRARFNCLSLRHSHTAARRHPSLPATPPPLAKMSTSSLSISSSLSLENSKNKIPQIGFGVYLSPPETCVASCKKAFEAGYRHIDTAQYYENETQVGKALAESGLPREDVYITSKILFAGEDLESTYQKIVDSVEKLAGKDGYADLFLIHSPNFGPEKRKLMWLAQEKAQEAGKVKDIGVSNYGIQHIEEIKSFGKIWPPTVNQIEVGLFPNAIMRKPLTGDSCTLGASSARSWNTARRTRLLSRPTAQLSVTRSRRTQRSWASARSTTQAPTKCSSDGASKRVMCHYPRATLHPVSSAMLMFMASRWTTRIWPSSMASIRVLRVRLCRQ